MKHVRLTIDIHYHDPSTEQEIRDRLEALVDMAAGEGLFTGDGPLEIEGLSHNVTFFGHIDVRALHTGDEVFWTDPDDGLCSRHLVILTIDVRGDVVVITTDDGRVLECLAGELS